MSVIQVDGAPVALRECFISLNPVRFSPAMLVAMDKVIPSTGTKVINLKVTFDTLNMNKLAFPYLDFK